MYASAESVRGTITGIEDHGTVVLMWIEQEDGREVMVPFDHSPFRWLLEGEGAAPEELIGREIEYDGEVVWLDADLTK